MSTKFDTWFHNDFTKNFSDYSIEFGRAYTTNGDMQEWRSITILKPKVSNFLYHCKIVYKEHEWAVVDFDMDGKAPDMLRYSQIEEFITAVEDGTGALFDEYR